MPATCLRIRSVPPITSLTSSMLRGHSGCARTTLPGLLRLARSRSDRKSTRLNSSHVSISYAVFCLKKKNLIRFGLPADRRRPGTFAEEVYALHDSTFAYSGCYDDDPFACGKFFRAASSLNVSTPHL